MIQQANFKESEAGNEKYSGEWSARSGMWGTVRPVDRLGWMALLVLMMFSPMASFEQDGRRGVPQRQSVAVHRQKTARLPAGDCCDPSASNLGARDPRVAPLTYPDARSLEQADREMIRNHALYGENVILPSLAMPQTEDADMDMDLMFRMSNAVWMTNLETADLEMDNRFRVENLLPEWKMDFQGSDNEMNDRFRLEQQPA